MGEMQNILFGTYERLLDDKNRLSLPSKIVNKLSPKVYIMNGHSKAMYIYPQEYFEAEAERTFRLDRDKKVGREISLARFADVDELEIDSVNRIRFDVSIMKKYGLNKAVTIVGNFDHLEIWNTDEWNKYHQEIIDRYDENTEVYENDKQ